MHALLQIVLLLRLLSLAVVSTRHHNPVANAEFLLMQMEINWEGGEKNMWGLFPSKRVKSSTDQCKRPLHSVPCSQSHNVIMNAVCLVEEIINTRRMSAPLFSSQGWRFYKDFKFILFNVWNPYASVQWRKQLQQATKNYFLLTHSNDFKIAC